MSSKLGYTIGVVAILGMLGGYVVSAKFTAAEFENSVIFGNKKLEGSHSQVNKILQTSGITVKNFSETKIKVIEARIKMYADKPQMMMMWIKENPENIDSKLWENFQRQTEVYYTQFKLDQDAEISKRQAYQNYLDTTVKGTVSQIVWSYPKPETKKIMEQVISTEGTKETFKTGVDVPVNPF